MSKNPELPFHKFIFRREQLVEIGILLSITTIIYLLLNNFYPFPNCTEDSPSYLQSAALRIYNGYRPIGYSVFIRICSLLSKDIAFVMLMQFALHIASCTILIYTIKYFIPPHKKIFFYLLGLFVVFNEASIYLTRWIMSDSIFISLTVIWFTSSVWMIAKRITPLNFILHFTALFFLMKVRYAGFIFPVIEFACFPFIFSWRKNLLLLIPSLMISSLVYVQGLTTNRVLYNVDTFSGFTGWSQGNNTSVIFPHIRNKVKLSSTDDSEIQWLFKALSEVPDTCYSWENIKANNFIWKNYFPGKGITGACYYGYKETWHYNKCWVYCGKMLSKFSFYLIKNYPLEYLRYFILPNSGLIFFPISDVRSFSEYTPDTYTLRLFHVRQKLFTCNYDFYGNHLSDFSYYKYTASWFAAIILVFFLLLYHRRISLNRVQKLFLLFLFVFVFVDNMFLIFSLPVSYRFVVHLNIFLAIIIYAASNILFLLYRKSPQTPKGFLK